MALHWILGSEPLQQREHRAELRAQIAAHYPHYQRHYFALQTVQDWQQLSHAAHEWSDLFADHHLIECHIQAKIPKEGFTLLQQWTQQRSNNADLSVIFMVEKPEWVKSSDYQPLLKAGSIQWARPVYPKDFMEWLKKRARKLGLKLAHDAILCLARYSEGNVVAAHQFLEKLRILKQGVITEQDIVHHLTYQVQASVFDLIDAAFSGNTEKSFRILATLNSEGVEPNLVLWAITREVRTIISIGTAVQAGMPFKAACEAKGVWQSRATIIHQALTLVPLHRFYRLLSQAHSIDSIIKGIKSQDFNADNPYEAIGRWLLMLDKWLNKDRHFVA